MLPTPDIKRNILDSKLIQNIPNRKPNSQLKQLTKYEIKILVLSKF